MDWMFVLPNEMPNSPNTRALKQILKTYQSPQLTHRNLVFTGEVKPEKIGAGLNKDMEFRQLAIYNTAVLGLGYGMPMSRIASIIGAEVKIGSGSDDLANEGYWAMINNVQAYRENLDNTQIWKKYFDVEIRFNKAWKQNEIKEQQRNSVAIANIMNLNRELVKYKKKVNIDYFKRIMYIDDIDLEDLTPEELEEIEMQKEMQMQGINPQNQQNEDKKLKNPDNKTVERGGATDKYREDKKKQVKNSQKLKSEMKGKMTHNVTQYAFNDKLSMFVKGSRTRKAYYSIKDGIFTSVISTPDENFKLVIRLSDINKTIYHDIIAHGEEVMGTE
jgi:hypothetical protein